MRYELNVQRHQLRAHLHLFKEGHEVKWRIGFRAPGTSCSNQSARVIVIPKQRFMTVLGIFIKSQNH